MSTKGILKAGNKIQTNLTGASNYDLKVGGVSVSSATSSITLGPYEDDQFYELTVNSGAVSVSCYDALINGVTSSVALANLGSASAASISDKMIVTNCNFSTNVTSCLVECILDGTTKKWKTEINTSDAAPTTPSFPVDWIVVWIQG